MCHMEQKPEPVGVYTVTLLSASRNISHILKYEDLGGREVHSTKLLMLFENEVYIDFKVQPYSSS